MNEPYTTHDTKLVAYLVFRGCRLMETIPPRNGARQVHFVVDLQGKPLSELETDYLRSEYHQVDSIARSLTNKVLGR